MRTGHTRPERFADARARDAATLLPNLQGISWNEQQPGYLAGIVAASISKIRPHRRHRRHGLRPGCPELHRSATGTGRCP